MQRELHGLHVLEEHHRSVWSPTSPVAMRRLGLRGATMHGHHAWQWVFLNVIWDSRRAVESL